MSLAGITLVWLGLLDGRKLVLLKFLACLLIRCDPSFVLCKVLVTLVFWLIYSFVLNPSEILWFDFLSRSPNYLFPSSPNPSATLLWPSS